MRSKLSSGWNMPPGCHRVPGDEDSPCAVCCHSVGDCVCPECPECWEEGNPECYARSSGHGLRLSVEQELSRQRARVAVAREHLQEAEEMLGLMLASAVEFPEYIEDSPDPWR